MRRIGLRDGTDWPVLGLGTWRMGESQGARKAEVAAVRRAIELGYRLIDTAEMYGDGGAEEVVGQAVAEALRAGDVRRDELVIVSKVLPHNASRRGTEAACERSRRRLGLDRIDLYLLHWRGAHPLRDTVAAMHALRVAGAIARWGVSNLDTGDMQELDRIASDCVCNQIYYCLGQRGPEFGLLPWLRHRGMPLMAYSPIDQGRLARDPLLAELGAARNCSAAQVALAWVLAQPGVIAIPKAAKEQHLRDNLAAESVRLSSAELRRIDDRFAPPTAASPLAMT